MNGTHREVVPKEAMMENMYVISRHGHPVMVDQSGMPEHVITLSDSSSNIYGKRDDFSCSIVHFSCFLFIYPPDMAFTYPNWYAMI
jgi:hypothetical protein